MHKSHMKKLLKMDRFHLVIIMCQHCAHYKAYKMDVGPIFFLSSFGPPNHAKTFKFDHNYLKVFFKILKLFSTRIFAQESLLLSKACKIKCLTPIFLCGTINHKSKGYPLSLIKYGLMPSFKFYSLNIF